MEAGFAYLRRCYDRLRENAATVFIYGHSADENDAHIYRAIFESGAKRMYFGVYQADAETVQKLDGQLSKYQKMWGSEMTYKFFKSESANVWGD